MMVISVAHRVCKQLIFVVLHFVVVKKEPFKGFLKEKNKEPKGVMELFLYQARPSVMKEGIVKEALKNDCLCFE